LASSLSGLAFHWVLRWFRPDLAPPDDRFRPEADVRHSIAWAGNRKLRANIGGRQAKLRAEIGRLVECPAAISEALRQRLATAESAIQRQILSIAS